MCGIAGLLNTSGNPISALDLKRMCDVISYRGPDDSGYVLINGAAHEPYWKELTEDDFQRRQPDFFSHHAPQRDASLQGDDIYNVGLGHRRLSIIDTSPMGHQPMPNRTRDLWIVYNGEVYNHVELRAWLKERGHHFVSKSDTEVILHLYQDLGEACIHKLNGIFAFAIYDMRKRRLFVARDRYGAKPLYYTNAGATFAFASEVKALLELENVKRALNPQALSEYFTFQNTLGDLTLFEGIKLLPPGHFMMVTADDVRLEQYWDFAFDNDTDRGLDHYRDALRGLFREAIGRQLRSDVPVGAYLSGGMDTGAIVGVAADFVPRMKSFTIGFDMTKVTGLESLFDERADAEVMAALFGTEHYQMVMHAGDMEYALPRVIWHLEDLRVGMCYPGFYLSGLASKFVKTSLAGTGGDEVFAGYPWRYKRVLGCGSDDEFENVYYQYWQRLLRDEDKPRAFSPNLWQEVQDYCVRDRFRAVFDRFSSHDNLKRALYFEAKSFLHGLLVVEDKLSMAHSLEARVPLLDNELVDFALRVPSHHLVRFDADIPEQVAGKYLFRQTMQDLLPQRILQKPKQGFSAPEENWYKLHLMEYVRNTLFSSDSFILQYLRRDFIERILQEHQDGHHNHRLIIWSFLSVEWWCQIFLGNLYQRFRKHDFEVAPPHRHAEPTVPIQPAAVP